MEKVVIFGANGLLGQSLVKKFGTYYDVVASSIEKESFIPDLNSEYRPLDLTDRAATRDFIEEVKPDIIINTAAFTDVDGCEEYRDLCWDVNVRAVEYIIEGAARSRPVFIHLSSDYVFDGNNPPYSENDKPNPRGNYARSKLASENLVRGSELEYQIIRTQILFGIGHRVRFNFVTWVIDQLQKENKIRVVHDQVGTPTYAPDCSEAILRLLQKKAFGTYHVSGPDSISRYDFALKIAKIFELDETLIERISSDELAQKAPRPYNSTFVIDKLINYSDWMPHSLDEALKLLREEMQK
ncbi:MAG TPA: dTDP-4-dehydrorhamnose reductase [Calditrichaeota bacterium]|nr:dTDP-4-dehydrorhamnose reductase [Calditrichota bacterium]